MLNSSTLRQIWMVIEQMQARLILELNDSELVQQVQKRLETQALFSDSELNIAREYINSKLPLIRDLAQNRLIVT